MRWPWESKQDRARQKSIAVRSFAAAQTNRLLAGWTWDGGFSAQEIRSQLATIRGRSREMAKNNPAMKRFLQLFATNVVGDGFTFKSTPHDGVPGSKDYAPDTSAAKFIEYHFWRFCSLRDPNTGMTFCDASGRKTMAEMDILNAKTWARDGEYIMLAVPAANPYGISFRVIRPDALDELYFREATENDHPVYCGVEMHRENGKPLAYYFHTTDVRSGWMGHRGPLVRIPAERVIHGFTPEDEDQPRGIPLGHAALVKLKMMEEYDKAEITAARDEACSVRTYYAPADSDEPMADLTTEEYSDVAASLVSDKEAGQSEVLPMGWRQEVHTPQHPNRELTAFKVSMNKDISSAFGIEYANAFNDWAGVSFSSVRQGTISERDGWTMLQNQMIAQCKSKVFLLWLKSFLSYSISGGYPIEKIEKFSEHEFRGRRWMWVDPMKDMRAAEVAVDRGWKTNSQVASDMGGDFGDNIEELKREQTMKAGENNASAPILNGAQITAAIEVVQSYAGGYIAKDAAIALLTAAGIPLETATSMISKQKQAKPVEQGKQ